MTTAPNPFEAFEMNTSGEDLAEVSRLATQLDDLINEANALEELLNGKKQEIWRLKTGDLPAAMNKANMTSLTLNSGSTVKVVEVIKALLPKDESIRQQSFAYLREMGAAELIKRNLSMSFGRGEDERANAIKELIIQQAGVAPEDKQDVNWQTLTAWAKEQIKQGVSLNGDVLDLHIGFEAQVKQPK